MASSSNCLERFLYNYSHLIDFLSASLIIVLCLIILLPKVHDSFQTTSSDEDNLTKVIHNHQVDDSNNLTKISGNIVISSTAAETTTTTSVLNSPQISIVPHSENNHDHHGHHHNHKLPLGEVLICIGFFVFYIIGLGMGSIESRKQPTEPSMLGERKISTVCCSSTRCPASQRDTLESECVAKSKSHEEMLEGAHLFNDVDQEEQCVLLLNRHHNHHTHSKHHNHQPSFNIPNGSKAKKHADYGSTSRIDNKAKYEIISSIDDSFDTDEAVKKPSTVYVEEIRITRVSSNIDSDDEDGIKNRPPSIKVTIFGLILIALLILFDLDIHGLIESVKVFRAAATGALLYMAFFLILPREPAGCNSCSKEEA